MLHRTDESRISACSDAPGEPWGSPRVRRRTAGCQHGRMTLAEADLSTLVDEWLDWDQAAARLGVTAAKVRTMIRDHELAAASPTPGAGPQVPADFIDDDGLPVKGLRRAAHRAARRRVRRPRDHRLAVPRRSTCPGRPIDALRENRGAEVKRRAQAMALLGPPV